MKRLSYEDLCREVVKLREKLRAAEVTTVELAILEAALDEDTGKVIGLLYDLDEKRLDALIEAGGFGEISPDRGRA